MIKATLLPENSLSTSSSPESRICLLGDSVLPSGQYSGVHTCLRSENGSLHACKKPDGDSSPFALPKISIQYHSTVPKETRRCKETKTARTVELPSIEGHADACKASLGASVGYIAFHHIEHIPS